jgi:hypothetical protein
MSDEHVKGARTTIYGPVRLLRLDHPAKEFQTAAEVAAAYRISERKLRRIVRKHGVAVLRLGRELRFDARARASLKEALRCADAQDSESLPVPTPARSRSWGRSPASAYAAALKATTIDSPPKKRQRSRPKSSVPLGTANVVALEASRRR